MNATCGSCGKFFDLDNRVPRILKGCDHTICQICARKYFTSGGVRCPIDRIVTPVIDGNVENLDKNSAYVDHIFRRLLKNYNSDVINNDPESDARSQSTTSDEYYEAERKLKIPCAENNNHIAVLFCTECELHYCHTCSKVTHRTLSNHTMIKASQKQEGCIQNCSDKTNERTGIEAIDYLTCSICLELYDLDVRIPRILSVCGHTFCEKCTLQMLKGTVVKCPLDRKESHVLDGNIKSLRKDHSIIEGMYFKEIKKEGYDEKYLAEIKLGIPCDENNHHIAVFYCTKCGAHYCQKCAKYSHSLKSLSSHRMVKVTEKAEKVLFCPKHDNVAELYCEDERCEIDVKVMCGNCQSYGIHKGHQWIDINDAFQNKKERLLGLLNKTDAKITYLGDHIETIRQLPDCLENDQDYSEGKQNIHRAFKKYEALLNNWKQSELGKLEETATEKHEEQQKERELQYAKFEKLGILKERCSNAIKHEKPVFFAELRDIEKLGEEMTYVSAKNPRKRINFISLIRSPIEFLREIPKAIDNIVFISRGLNEEEELKCRERIQELGGIRDDILNGYRWSNLGTPVYENQNVVVPLSFWNFGQLFTVSAQKLNNTVFVFLGEMIGTINQFSKFPVSSKIIINKNEGSMKFFTELRKGNGLDVPIFCADICDERFIDHVLERDYMEDPFFEAL